jgi:hypothetical protein
MSVLQYSKSIGYNNDFLKILVMHFMIKGRQFLFYFMFNQNLPVNKIVIPL